MSTEGHCILFPCFRSRKASPGMCSATGVQVESKASEANLGPLVSLLGARRTQKGHM